MLAPALSVASVRRRSWRQSAQRSATARPERADERQVEQTQREEGEAILALADAAHGGEGRAVGFRGAVAERLRQGAARHVRAVHADRRRLAVTPGARRWCMCRAMRRPAASRGTAASGRDRQPGATKPRIRSTRFFRSMLPPGVDRRSRISRGFSVAPGEYDVFVVMRERVDPAAPRTRPEGCGRCASRSAFRTSGRAS